MYTLVTLIFSQIQPSCIVFGLEPRQVYQESIVGINLTIILFCLKRPSDDDVKYIGYNRRPILICLFQTKSKKRHFH